MNENEISYIIRGAIFEISNEYGPGLLESVYEQALLKKLRSLGLEVKNQVSVPVNYKGMRIEVGFRMDLLVENKVVIEIKSIDALAPIHFKQVQTYLKFSERKLGLLVNFNTLMINKSIHRIVNNL